MLVDANGLKPLTPCTSCIQEFQLYVWDTDNNDNLIEEVVKENDHAMDDVRYFCHTILAREFDWLNWGAKS